MNTRGLYTSDSQLGPPPGVWPYQIGGNSVSQCEEHLYQQGLLQAARGLALVGNRF